MENNDPVVESKSVIRLWIILGISISLEYSPIQILYFYAVILHREDCKIQLTYEYTQHMININYKGHVICLT